MRSDTVMEDIYNLIERTPCAEDLTHWAYRKTGNIFIFSVFVFSKFSFFFNSVFFFFRNFRHVPLLEIFNFRHVPFLKIHA